MEGVYLGGLGAESLTGVNKVPKQKAKSKEKQGAHFGELIGRFNNSSISVSEFIEVQVFVEKSNAT